MFQTGRKCTREEGWGRMRRMPTRTVPKRNHTTPHGRAALVAAVPPGRAPPPPSARRAKYPRRHAACRPELFRSEIARPHTGGPRLSRPCPLVAHPLHPRPGARSTRADTPHADPNCSEAKSRDPTREGRACRGRAPWSQHAVTGPGARSTRADTPHADPNCSEAKSRDPTLEGRACRGRAPWSQHVVTGPCTRSTRAAHGVGRRRAPPHGEPPHSATRRGRRGYFARRHAACRPELFRSEIARPHTGGTHSRASGRP